MTTATEPMPGSIPYTSRWMIRTPAQRLRFDGCRNPAARNTRAQRRPCCGRDSSAQGLIKQVGTKDASRSWRRMSKHCKLAQTSHLVKDRRSYANIEVPPIREVNTHPVINCRTSRRVAEQYKWTCRHSSGGKVRNKTLRPLH